MEQNQTTKNIDFSKIIAIQFLIYTLVIGVIPFSGFLEGSIVEGYEYLTDILLYLGFIAVGVGVFLNKKFSAVHMTSSSLVDKTSNQKRQQMCVVVSFAMFELAAIYGFVCFILSGDTSYSGVLALIAFLAMLLHFPRSVAN